MKWFLFFWVACSSLFAAEPTNFIRLAEEEGRALLQTAVTTYGKGEARVTLVGAIHIADEAYFAEINEELDRHPVVLFELIGGEDAARFLTGKGGGQEARVDGRPVAGLRGLYGSFASTMQLVEQIHHVDYSKSHFVHADLTRQEYEKVTAGRDDDLLAFALESNVKATELTGKPFGGLNMSLVMRAMLSGDGTGLKLEYMKLMEQGDESAAAITGQNLIIGDRNDKCFQVLAEQRKAGEEKVAIFYGAAHLPDMERRLLADGFTRRSHRWLTAWEVPQPEGGEEEKPR
ncbi:hypothetical protein [Roseibacillus ishigakijimensis]|uniref:TraB family protein n=1 Tax=Roseibacillus ishigakijimensis TaxID=454146 RepID=A0A934RMP1_9BACT|nr:hypothetical protein [Roseibacillus ishigakijimensis]MBK1832467.1 hypothetical protein [Roseibacillus ishigakijimensis]